MAEALDGSPSTAAEPESPDALLAAVAREGDRAAFAALFDHYAPRLKAFLLRGGLDEAAAEELVQEVMLVVWQRAGTYDPARAQLSTWIFTIARNRRIDLLRRRRFDGPEPFAPADMAPSTDGLVERSDWHRSLREALERLPSEQAEVLRWAYFEEKSHSVIAKEHGLPLGTVKSRVRLALRQLRALMEKRG